MIGVDEVGRGCLAGPLLVVAAQSYGELPRRLRDSKTLSQKQRQEILNMLSNCCNFGEGWVKATEVDSHGLASALRLGVARALAALKAEVSEEIIFDGKVNYVSPSFKKSQVHSFGGLDCTACVCR